MNVWMLDYDPVTAARWHCDAHVRAAPFTNAQVLAHAWHVHHNEIFHLDAGCECSDWLRYVVLPARNPILDAGQVPAPHAKSLFPGESPESFWNLCGQRIPSPRCDKAHVSELWASELGGNYRWLWQLTSELVSEFSYRFGKRHPVAHCVWTLELMPPALRPTAEEWAETKLDLPWAALRVVDGFYDSVASNRRYYNLMKAPEWTRREAPPWYSKQEAPATEEPN